jgi:hypothetical protein
MSGTAFRRLFDEIALPRFDTTGAYHDVDRILVTEDVASDHLVLRHEMIHDDLLQQTVFGNFQFAVRRAGLLSASTQVRAYLDHWLRAACDASRLTHECAATYLSIKAAHIDEHAALYDVLPEEYQGYFDLLSQHIDDRVPPTQLQYVIAKVVIEITMGAPLDRIVSLFSTRAEPTIPAEVAPDVRLVPFLKSVQEALPELMTDLQAVINNQDPTGARFDAISESDWMGLNLSRAEELERVAFDVTRARLYELGRQRFTAVPGNEHLSHVMRIVGSIASCTGLTADSILYSDAPRSTQGRSEIIHPLVRPDVRKESILLPDDDPSVEWAMTATAFVSLTSRELGDPSEWFAFGLPDREGRMPLARVSRAVFWAVLRQRRILASMGSVLPSTPAVVVGFESGRGAEFDQFYDRLMAEHRIGDSVIAVPDVIWYLGGDLMWWMTFLTKRVGDLQEMLVSAQPWGGSRQPSMELSSQAELLEIARAASIDEDRRRMPNWQVFRSPNLMGLAVRLLPGLGDFSGHVISALEHGSVHVVPAEERRPLFEQLRGPMTLLVPAVWDRF